MIVVSATTLGGTAVAGFDVVTDDLRSAWQRGRAWYEAHTGPTPGRVLTPSGAVTVTTPGAVVEGLAITGGVRVRAAGVTIRDCRIDGAQGQLCVFVDRAAVPGASVALERCELVGSVQATIGYDAYTMDRCRVHDFFGDGGKVGDDVIWRDSWMHTPTRQGATHSDGLQIQTAPVNALIERCWIDVDAAGTNAAMIIKADLGTRERSRSIVVDSCYLAGGRHSVMQIVDVPPRYIEDVTVSDNVMAPGWESTLPWVRYTASATAAPVRWVGNRTIEGLLIPSDGSVPEGSAHP